MVTGTVLFFITQLDI